MPRNFSELKRGEGTIPMLSPPRRKVGGRVPPRPPPIDARVNKYRTTSGRYLYVSLCSNFNMTEYLQIDINNVLLVFIFLIGITLFR